MASSQSRKKVVLQKYRTELLSTLSDCIEDVLPDLESAGAISIDQRDKVREYVEGKMPAKAIDYLLNDHIKRPLFVEINNNFKKLLEVMKKAPKCSPHCKALATTVENEIEMSSEMDEITKRMAELGDKAMQKVIEQRIRRRKNWQTSQPTGLPYGAVSFIYDVNGYGNGQGSSNQKHPLIKPLFLAKGPSDELYVRDYCKHRLVIFDNINGDKLQYSHYLCGEGNGQGLFKDIAGIATSKDYLYVADCQLDYIQKLHIKNGVYAGKIGSPGSRDGEFDSPFGLALDEDNSLLYVCDYGNHRIQVFKNDTFSKNFGRLGASDGRFNHPGDIALNKYRNQLFVTDMDNHRVQVFTTDGFFLSVFGDPNVNNVLRYPFGVFCTYSQVLISSVHNDSVYMFDAEGTSSHKVQSSDYSYVTVSAKTLHVSVIYMVPRK